MQRQPLLALITHTHTRHGSWQFPKAECPCYSCVLRVTAAGKRYNSCNSTQREQPRMLLYINILYQARGIHPSMAIPACLRCEAVEQREGGQKLPATQRIFVCSRTRKEASEHSQEMIRPYMYATMGGVTSSSGPGPLPAALTAALASKLGSQLELVGTLGTLALSACGHLFRLLMSMPISSRQPRFAAGLSKFSRWPEGGFLAVRGLYILFAGGGLQ